MYISLQVEHFFMITRNRRSQRECKTCAQGSARQGGQRALGTQVTVCHCGDHGHPQLRLLVDTKNFLPPPDSVCGRFHLLHPTPEQAPCPPTPSLWRQGIRNTDQHYAFNFTGAFPGVCEGIYPPTTETTGCGLFLEMLMQLIRFQECVSELEQ